MMKQWKKIGSILLIAAMVLSLASCGGNDQPQTSSQDTTAQVSSEEDEYIDESSETAGDTSTTAESGDSSKNNTSDGKTQTSSQKGSNTSSKASDSGKIELPKTTLKNKTIKVMHGWDPNSQWLKDWADAFSKNYGGKVELIYAKFSDKATRLAALKASNNAPDIVCSDQNMDWPTLINKGLVMPLDDVIDFSVPLWDGVKSSLEATKINGKHYFAATDVRVFSSVCYSKKAMRDAGLTDPRTLYYEGKWDWNTFMDYAKKLTNPSTGQKGFASVYPEGLISTTGKDYLSVDSKGNYKTNLTDPDIVRAMDMFEELGPAGIDAWKLLDWNKMMDEVKRGKIGMLVTPNPQLYLADAFKARTVTYAPLPKDPKADKYYEHFAVSGYYIPVGAKNIEGAVCYINSIRYTLIPELNQAGRERNKGLYGYTDDDYKLDDYRLMHSAPVTTNFERLNADITYESLWGKIIKNNRKWSSIVQEYTPVINGLLEKING